MEQTDRNQGIFYGVWVVAACFVLLFLFAGAGFYSFSIFIKPLEDEFGWSRAAISLAMSIYMILHGLAGPFVGHAVETYGPKKVMTLFALLSGAPMFIFFAFRTGKNRYHFTMSEPISLSPASRSERDAIIRQSAQMYADTLEAMVRNYPLQWYHFKPFLAAKSNPDKPELKI